MKAKSFYKNNKHNNMNPKEKENNQEEELKTQATPNECDEETVGQEVSQENEAPLTEEEKLAQELEKANEQIEEQKDKYLRLSAEFDNYRKRTMKEKAELILNVVKRVSAVSYPLWMTLNAPSKHGDSYRCSCRKRRR